MALPALARSLWSEDGPLTIAAAQALGNIGPSAAPVVEDLFWLWKVEQDNEPIRSAAEAAAMRIAPGEAARRFAV